MARDNTHVSSIFNLSKLGLQRPEDLKSSFSGYWKQYTSIHFAVVFLRIHFLVFKSSGTCHSDKETSRVWTQIQTRLERVWKQENSAPCIASVFSLSVLNGILTHFLSKDRYCSRFKATLCKIQVKSWFWDTFQNGLHVCLMICKVFWMYHNIFWYTPECKSISFDFSAIFGRLVAPSSISGAWAPNITCPVYTKV